MYVIAVDADGVREEQKNLVSVASFEFVNKAGQNFNYSSNFTEFIETSFQHYSYALPVLEEDDEGNYTLTLGCYTYGTAQFKLDIFTRVLVESLERFGMKLASCAQAHNSSSAIRSSRRVIRS